MYDKTGVQLKESEDCPSGQRYYCSETASKLESIIVATGHIILNRDIVSSFKF